MHNDSRSRPKPEGTPAPRPWWLFQIRPTLSLAVWAISPAPVLAQPTNDDFDSAPEIAGSSGFVAGSNVGATIEVGEPAHAGRLGGASVWWSWTAPASDRVVFSTIGSHFDTVLAVYQGDAIEDPVLVAENDDELPAEPDFIVIGAVFGYQSRVTFEAAAGTTYRIAVDGVRGGSGPATGAVVLAWALGQGNDNFVDATGIAGSGGVALGSTKGATSELGEPDHLGLGSGTSVWWRWTAPSGGPVTFGLVRSEEEDFETLLAVYEGQGVEDLFLVAGNDASSFFLLNLESEVTFEAEEGTTYWIAIDGVFGETPDVVLRWTRDPENDAFADAFEITGAAGTATGDNIFATPDPWSEPDHGGQPGAASVWWNWMAPAGGLVTLDTFGSTFDTILAVYVGDEVWVDDSPFPILDLTLLLSNDDAGGGAQSRVTFGAVAGTTYRIAVANYDPADRGDIALNWRLAGPLTEPLRIESISRLPDGGFRFVLRGPPGATGILFRSSGQSGWEEWMPFALDGGTMEVTDPDAATSATRLYRAGQ